jgi:hypothetical protein
MVCGNAILFQGFKDDRCLRLVEQARVAKSMLPTSDSACAALMEKALKIDEDCPYN